LSGQCIGRDSLRKKIISLTESSALLPAEKIKKLLEEEERINNCSYRHDSTHVFLLRKIGAAYYYLADYVKAAQYLREAIEILTTNADKPSVDAKQLVLTYYYLAVFYDSLNMVTEKMRALERCADFAIKLNVVDRSSLSALYAWVEYFYDVGDYHRCISQATLCETLGIEFAKKR
jgi:tetratricopeptide (TPR) repeat protein